ncbi:protein DETOXIFICATION 35-like [Malus domestica]|uniref:protein DETOXIFICATION 35-like n=1 Tax=Malus domestica TaxID=3750 RepID=UPI0039759E32
MSSSLLSLSPSVSFSSSLLVSCMNFWNWEVMLLLMLLLGINAAISTRVSNELGMGRPRAAKYSVCVAVLQALIVGVLAMVAIFISRDYSAMIFTSSGEMQLAVARLAYLLGVTMLLNYQCYTSLNRSCYWRWMASDGGLYKFW